MQTRDRLDRLAAAWLAGNAPPKAGAAFAILQPDERRLLEVHVGPDPVTRKAATLGLSRREYYSRIDRTKHRALGALLILESATDT